MGTEGFKGALLSILLIASLIAPAILLTLLSHVSYAQSPPEIPSDEVKIAADKLIQKISNSFKMKGNLSLAEAWEGAFAGEPILVYTPEEEPCYYIIPVIRNNKVISNIGFSAKTGEWMWYTETYPFSKFPPVSVDEAEKVVSAYLQRRGLEGSLGTPPMVKTMPDKCLYWTFPLLVDGKAVTKIYVNFFSIEQVSTEESMESKAPLLEDVGGGGGITTIATNITQVPAQTASHTIADVPHHYQVKNYYCGPACLEMVFDYYGPDILQYEIANAARTYPNETWKPDMRRAAHFSDLSTSVGDDEPAYACTGYTGRDLGYAAFMNKSENYWLNELKTLIDENYPIIVITWYDESHSGGHWRVVIGYDDSINEIIVHDPWYTQGPNVHFSYTTFQDLWNWYGYYWGLFTHPWVVSVGAPAEVYIGSTFTVTGTVTYPCPPPYNTDNYPASSCQATITLPPGLSLAPSETATKTLGTGSMTAGTSTDVSWQVTAVNTGSYTVAVSAEGMVSGSVPELPPYPAYSYTDRIGGDQISTIINVVLNPHDSIYIDGNDNFIPANGVVAGSGTAGDPYIIENWHISAENANGIEIRNTTAYFIIRNCYVHYGRAQFKRGIYFDNVINGKIENTTIDNNHFGILLMNSSNNNIENCIVENNGYGVRFYYSDNNSIIGCNIYDSQIGEGIRFDNSNNNNIIDFIVSHSDNVNVHIYCSDNNIIGGGTISNTYVGVSLERSSNNNIINCVVQNHDDSGVVLFDYSNNNSIANCTILSNGYGIFSSWYSDNNRIYHNNFVNNAIQAHDDGTNYWDNDYPSGGNYWSDYTGSDANGDGIGDMSYNIPGDNNQDHYPLMCAFGFVTLYKVNLNANLYLGMGSKLVVKFYNYSDVFENESVYENFTPPAHVVKFDNVWHPENIGVRKVRLDLSTDNTEDVISTLASFTVRRSTLMARITEIDLRWPYAPFEERSVLMGEIVDIDVQWPYAPF